MKPRYSLIFDIGNTTLKMGVCQAGQILETYSLPAQKNETADNLGLRLLAILAQAKIEASSINSACICSVVPCFNRIIQNALSRYLQIKPAFIGRDIIVPLQNHYENPQSLGMDRLTASYAARQLFNNSDSLIVVDFGTAITFDCIRQNAYLGGLIFPGPGIAAAALANSAARLPLVEMGSGVNVAKPERNTGDCMRNGLLFGYAALTDGLCRQLAKSLQGQVLVAASGGYARVIAEHCDMIDEIVPDLVLQGVLKLSMSTCNF